MQMRMVAALCSWSSSCPERQHRKHDQLPLTVEDSTRLSLSLSYMQHEREEHRRPRENSNYLPMRISPSGVGGLLISTLYINLAAQLVGFLHQGLGNQLMRTLYRPTVLPLAVAVVSFLNVAVDWSAGRTVKDLGSWMQKARRQPLQSSY